MPLKTSPLIVIALESEGQGKLEGLGFEVVYCGLGKVNASHRLTRKQVESSGKNPYVLNLDSAGSGSFPTGALVTADRFVQRDKDVTGLGFTWGHTPFEDDPPMLTFPQHFAHLPYGICDSGDSFLQGPPPIPFDNINMEAYAQPKICLRESVPFACVKYITDGADGNASDDWQTNLKHAADTFTALLAAA